MTMHIFEFYAVLFWLTFGCPIGFAAGWWMRSRRDR